MQRDWQIIFSVLSKLLGWTLGPRDRRGIQYSPDAGDDYFLFPGAAGQKIDADSIPRGGVWQIKSDLGSILLSCEKSAFYGTALMTARPMAWELD
jgi:hypothetical protein